jgi:hypothetical protein
MKIWMSLLLTIGLVGILGGATAQLPNAGQNHADILKFMSELPPDVMKKIERVGKLLQEDLRQGKLTQAQIGNELASES